MQSFTLVFGVATFRCTILDLQLDQWSYEEDNLFGMMFLNLQVPGTAMKHIDLCLSIAFPLTVRRATRRYVLAYAAAQQSG